MSRCIIKIILLLLVPLSSFCQDDEDSTAVTSFTDSLRLLRFSADISKPVFNSFSDKRKSYEFEADYYWKKELYVVGNAGFGKGRINDSSLQYTSSNVFIKAGLNKSMLSRVMPGDWDMAFIGFRYGVALIKRGDAFYRTKDNFWGSTTGIIPGTNLTAHWAEVAAGVKLELYRGIFTGWTVSGRFLLNKKQLRELPPSYISGYGKGDKNSVFDLNFYLGYAIKWNRKSLQHTAADTALSK